MYTKDVFHNWKKVLFYVDYQSIPVFTIFVRLSILNILYIVIKKKKKK